MSGKKQAAKAETKAAAPVKKAGLKVIKRDENGKKIMKVARGTARALRRVGLVKNWRFTAGAKQMLAPAQAVPVLIATL
jgi:hypothetical protein